MKINVLKSPGVTGSESKTRQRLTWEHPEDKQNDGALSDEVCQVVAKPLIPICRDGKGSPFTAMLILPNSSAIFLFKEVNKIQPEDDIFDIKHNPVATFGSEFTVHEEVILRETVAQVINTSETMIRNIHHYFYPELVKRPNITSQLVEDLFKSHGLDEHKNPFYDLLSVAYKIHLKLTDPTVIFKFEDSQYDKQSKLWSRVYNLGFRCWEGRFDGVRTLWIDKEKFNWKVSNYQRSETLYNNIIVTLQRILELPDWYTNYSFIINLFNDISKQIRNKHLEKSGFVGASGFGRF
ncbi:MAG: hypothetical protein KAH18_10295 [Psychromonas sp.]|nr:hypothetical protein [Psychromonas sp.]